MVIPRAAPNLAIVHSRADQNQWTIGSVAPVRLDRFPRPAAASVARTCRCHPDRFHVEHSAHHPASRKIACWLAGAFVAAPRLSVTENAACSLT